MRGVSGRSKCKHPRLKKENRFAFNLQPSSGWRWVQINWTDPTLHASKRARASHSIDLRAAGGSHVPSGLECKHSSCLRSLKVTDELMHVVRVRNRSVKDTAVVNGRWSWCFNHRCGGRDRGRGRTLWTARFVPSVWRRGRHKMNKSANHRLPVFSFPND